MWRNEVVIVRVPKGAYIIGGRKEEIYLVEMADSLSIFDAFQLLYDKLYWIK